LSKKPYIDTASGSLRNIDLVDMARGSSFADFKEYRPGGHGSWLFVCRIQGLKNRWTWLAALRLQFSMIIEPLDNACSSLFAFLMDYRTVGYCPRLFICKLHVL